MSTAFIRVNVSCNEATESDIIAKLKEVEDRQQYIRSLIASYAARPFPLPAIKRSKIGAKSGRFQFCLFVKPDETDLIAILEANRPASGLVKRLIRADIKRAKTLQKALIPPSRRERVSAC